MKSIAWKNLHLSPEDLRIDEFLAQKRGIIDYGNMSNDKLFNALKSSENKDKTRIDEIREETKELGHKLSRRKQKN